MRATASSSISSRTGAGGHASPRMCSFSASPLPTPSRKRSSPSSTAEVATAWAATAGWVRTVGQVTAVCTGSDVASASAPITDQTNGACPWTVLHGW